MKLRLRSRKTDDAHPSAIDPLTAPARKKIVKRAPPRSANKRRRAADDDMGRDDGMDSDFEIDANESRDT